MNTHVTRGHECGRCGRYGHGQIECGDPNAYNALRRFRNVLPASLHCRYRCCDFRRFHTSSAHRCSYGGHHGHSVLNCIRIDAMASSLSSSNVTAQVNQIGAVQAVAWLRHLRKILVTASMIWKHVAVWIGASVMLSFNFLYEGTRNGFLHVGSFFWTVFFTLRIKILSTFL